MRGCHVGVRTTNHRGPRHAVVAFALPPRAYEMNAFRLVGGAAVTEHYNCCRAHRQRPAGWARLSEVGVVVVVVVVVVVMVVVVPLHDGATNLPW